jgi:uncharacterized delta-60 repeat protein
VRAKLAAAALGMCAFLGVAPATPATAGVPGALDLSFGERGVIPFSASSNGVETTESMTVGAGNEIFVLRRSFGCGPTGCAEQLTLRRFLPGGQLDSSFGGGTVPIPLFSENGSVIAVSPDGKPVVAVASGYEVNLLRLNQDGTPDASFGGDGSVKLEYGGNAAHLQIRTLGNGEVVLALNSSGDPAGRSELILARFLPNGDPNPAFGAQTGEAGGPGWVAIPTNVALGGLAVSDAGQITVIGCCLGSGDSVYERRRADGRLLNRLDATRPWKRLKIDADAAVGSVIPLSSGKVYVVGRAGGAAFAAKLRADGSLEWRYGGSGIVRIGAMKARYATPVALVDGAGRLVVAGQKEGTEEFGLGDLLVSRRLPRGGKDQTFGNKSVVDLSSLGLGGLLSKPVSIGMQSSGRIVLFGKSSPQCVRTCPRPRSALVRLFGGSAKPKHRRHHRR